MNTFSHALIHMKSGFRATRLGWPQGEYAYYVPAASYRTQTEAARKEFGESVPYQAYIAHRTADGSVAPWVATQADILSNDWHMLS